MKSKANNPLEKFRQFLGTDGSQTHDLPPLEAHDDPAVIASLDALPDYAFPYPVAKPPFLVANLDAGSVPDLEELTDALCPLPDGYSFLLDRHADGTFTLAIVRE